MRKILFILAYLFFSIGVFAQSTIIKGELLDSITHEAEHFATIRVFKKPNLQTPIAMSVSNENGKIAQEVKGVGDYVITISSIGRKVITRQVKIEGATSTFNLGTLLVQDDAKMMKSVVVMAQKPLEI